MTKSYHHQEGKFVSRKKSLQTIGSQRLSVDDIGPESTPETRELSTFDPKATPNPTPYIHDEKLAQIIAQWPLLSGDLKTKIYECVIVESKLADAQRSA